MPVWPSAGITLWQCDTPTPKKALILKRAPWSLTPGQTTQDCASYNNVNTNCLTWPVAQTALAVFLADETFAAAVNQDGTINSANNPAPVGSIATVCTTRRAARSARWRLTRPGTPTSPVIAEA